MSESIPEHSIAIVGMSGRFPKAKNLDEYWANLKEGRDCITFFTEEEMRGTEMDLDKLLKNPDFVAARGVLDDLDLFDAKFFGFSPRDARLMDPHHRFWLECAWEALEHAGYDPEKYAGAIGVYAGAGYLQPYMLYNLAQDRQFIENLVRIRAVDSFQTLITNEKDYLPTLTSYKFNLTGPSINLQTACSTSLVAVNMSVQSLLNYECDMCLAGAVSITLPQERGYIWQEGGMNSKDGHCHTFDADAAGTVFSSGIGCVVLKRLEDAIEDGDHIEAVIRGVALNNDGANKVSFVAPSVDGQAEVITMAQEMADVDPSTISYVEAHGTATPLGDPIEITGLTKAFRRDGKAAENQFCAIGSVKSNIGHTDSAAGIAGLLKTVLALKNEEIPPSINYSKPNPNIDFDSSPFYVIDKSKPWPRKTGEADHPRRAGLSSFGVGGTNAHLVLEEAPEMVPGDGAKPGLLLPLSGKTATALDSRVEDMAQWLADNSDANLADAAYTLQVGRQDFAHRGFAVISYADDAKDAFGENRKRRIIKAECTTDNPDIVFMFPGQGAQHPGMGQELYETEAVFKEEFDKVSDVLKPLLDVDLRAVIFSDDEGAAEQLKATGLAQPALFAIEYALAKLWQSWGIEPTAMIGHSVGEYVAACLAGVFSVEDAADVLATRARLMQDMPGGDMLALRLSEEEAQSFLTGGVELAAINAPNLCVLSGPSEAITALTEKLEADGKQGIALHTSHAFHSAMMEPVLKPFSEKVASVKPNKPTIPFISCVTGTWITNEQATDPDYWAQQLRGAVRFSPGILEITSAPNKLLLEVGPSRNLSGSVGQHKRKDADGKLIPAPASVPSLPHASSDAGARAGLMEALGRLWLNGVRIDWATYYGEERRLRLALPTYPFERERFWIDPPALVEGEAVVVQNQAAAPVAAEPDVTPVAAAAEPAPVLDRKAQIRATTVNILYELSGIEIAEDMGDNSFVELGMDSLFLTQASAQLQQDFGLKITFRQLLEEITTLNALVDLIDQDLPADALPDQAPAPVAQTAADPAATAALAAMPVASGGALAKQLATLSQQVAALEAHSVGGGGGKSSGPAVHTILPENYQEKDSPHHQKGRFGPYKPPEQSREGGLTADQQAWLDKLIFDLNAKTPKSKQFTEDSRKALADPRNVANFRYHWKELVYQIVSERTDGSRMWDIDGNEYVDITMGFGVGFLGHRPPFVTKAVAEQLEKGYEVGPQTPLAITAANELLDMVGMERVSFCNTGSEAVMAALRMARTVSGRQKIVYFSGDYHGTFDEVLGRTNILKGGLRTLPAAPGITQPAMDSAMILDYGDPATLEVIENHADEIAAVLVEPVQSRHPEHQPVEFVKQLRELTQRKGIALILDEIITGFRVHQGGIQAAWDIKPDMATYGKILGGGIPIGAVAGSAEYLDAIDGGPWQFGDDSIPEKNVTFFAGTFVRHPIAMAAAHAVLTFLKEQGPQLQEGMNARAQAFADDINAYTEERGVPMRIRVCSSWFRFDYPQEMVNVSMLFPYMLSRGVYIREAAQNCFFSIAHSDEDIAFVTKIIKEGIAEMQTAGFLAKPGEALVVGGATTTIAADKKGRLQPGDRIPLTESQREIWLALEIDAEAAPAYNQAFTMRLKGEVDVDKLRKSVQTIYARHESFHLRFERGGESQVMDEVKPLDIPLVDLSGEGADAREARALELQKSLAAEVFDPETGPMMRMQILKLASDLHVMVFVMHHLISDGWSSVVFLEEMGQAYNALQKGEKLVLPEPKPFSDYAVDQVNAAGSDEVMAARRYWKSMYETIPPPLELPTDHPRPAKRSFDGATMHWAFSEVACRAAKDAVKAQGVTLFATLFAAFNVMVSRLAGVNDLAVGIPVAGQAAVGENELFGHCVNLLPLRTQINEDTTSSALMKHARSAVLDAYDHQQTTFGSVLQDLDIRRDPTRQPLVEVLFNLDPAGDKVKFDGLKIELAESPKSAVQFDLFFNITQGSNAKGELTLVMDCDYRRDLYHEDTIKRWVGYLENLLCEMARDAEAPVDQLPMMNEAQQQQVLKDWNDTAQDLPYNSIVEAFAAQVAANPGKMATVLPSLTGGSERQLSYEQLDQRSSALAADLAAAGVTAGAPVMVCMKSAPEVAVALLGILKAGGVYVPVEPDYPDDRLALILEDTAAAHVLSQPENASRNFATAQVIEIGADWGAGREANVPDVQLQPDSPAYICYTSGSTGKPKGVVIPHVGVLRLVLGNDYASFGPDMVILQLATLAFDAATFEIWGPLLNGGCVVSNPSEKLPEPKQLKAIIEEQGVTTAWLTSTLFNTLIDDSPECLKGMREILVGGEALSVSHIRKAQTELPDVQLINGYGPTESTTFTCTYTIPSNQPEAASIPIGKPITNTQCYVVNRGNQPAAINEPGELMIGGKGLATGYWKRESLTGEKFVTNPFGDGRVYHSGDSVRWRADGLIDYYGRLDGQIKLRGFRVEPGEIEHRLLAHPDIQQVTTTIREDVPGDRRLAAYYVLADGAQVTVTELRRHLTASLPNYMMPQYFIELTSLPMTANGKVDKQALPAPAGVASAEQPHVEPRNGLEEKVVAVWKDLLAVQKVSVHDRFYDLGGHSLLAVRVATRLEDELGVRPPLIMIMTQTPADVAEECGRLGAQAPSIEVPAATTDMATEAPVGQASEVAGQKAPGLADKLKSWLGMNSKD